MKITLVLLLVRVALVFATNKKATKRIVILKVATETLKYFVEQYLR